MTDPNSQVVERVLHATLTEQRRARRWKIFFRLVYLAIFLFAVNSLVLSPSTPSLTLNEPQVALINLTGVIDSQSLVASADNLMTALGDAFADKNTSAVILVINSPGGSAVEAGRIHDEIIRLRKLQPDIKVYAVIDELGASAAYYVACAADDIYANRASLVGSIGVKIDGFGFVDVMQKLGVERRLITAGESKGFLDPFSPLSQQDQAYAQDLIDTIHAQFKTAVQQGRGKRLADDPQIFSGLVWTGEQAQKLGLIDNLGDAPYVAREVVGIDNIVTFNPPINLMELLVSGLGANVTQLLAQQKPTMQL